MVGGDCCNGQCNAGICGPVNPCAHDQCVTGVALTQMCSPCTAQICQADQFCCTNSWDQICVNEVGSVCGLPCGPCTPDMGKCAVNGDCCSKTCANGVCQPPCKANGQSCMNFGECCSQTCSAGVCGAQCKADGQMCAVASDCCTGQCSGGVCGKPNCGQCIGQKCSSQLSACLGDPQCQQDLGCLVQCKTPQCGLMCVGGNQKAVQVLICLATNCGAGTCF
jgi:hypothetical protein